VTLIEKLKEKEAILSTFHDDPIQGGHTGITKTLAKVKRYYYWKGTSKDITEYIRKCQKCQKSKATRNTITPLTIKETPIKAFDRVIVDCPYELVFGKTNNLPKHFNSITNI